MARKPMKHTDLAKKFESHAFAAVTGQSDLSCALITTAFVENALMTLLANFFLDCETAKNLFKGALGDMAKCADMAYCLGFINKGMLTCVKKVGDIRNMFAHCPEPLSFDDANVRQIIDTMKMPYLTNEARSKIDAGEAKEPLHGPRHKFLFISVCLYGIIMATASKVERQKSPGGDDFWPH